MGRRDEVLDAAIAVLGRQGVRGLTHRAVDAAAGAPSGTTSNHFRTREALFDGIVDRFAERERAALPGAPPRTPAGLAEALAAFAVTATTERRDVTLARFALLVEAANRPHLQRKLGETAAGVTGWAVDWVRSAGFRHPERDAALLGAQMDAMVLHQLAYPDPGFDPRGPLTALIDLLISAPRGSR